MTLKELIMKVDFDRIRPYLEDFEAEHLDSIYADREVLRRPRPQLSQ